jgi:hypothetical protein
VGFVSRIVAGASVPAPPCHWASPSGRGGQAGHYRSSAAWPPPDACRYSPLPPFGPSTSGADLLCPLLTSAPRSRRLATPPVPKDTMQISRGKPGVLHRAPAGFTALALDGYGLRESLPARPANSASYPVSVRRVATLLHASFRRPSRDRPCVSLVLHLHQVAQGTCTPQGSESGLTDFGF